MGKLQLFTTRLLAKDVVEIKKRAGVQGIPWQTWLRVMVTRMLKRKEEIG